MITAYNVDERIMSGLDALLKARLNAQITTNNAGETDGIHMDSFPDNVIYNKYITLPEVMNRARSFPAICFFLADATSEVRTNPLFKDTLNVKLQVFTSGLNSDTLSKRYIAAIREVIETYDDEISSYVFRALAFGRRYFTPITYNDTSKVYISELSIRITVEVRR